MTESDARNIFIVRAVEGCDPQGTVISHDVLFQAAKDSGGTALLEEGSMEKRDEEGLGENEAEFLAARARSLEGHLRQKGAIPGGLDGKRIPGWLGPLLIVAVLLLGFYSANLGRDGAELNILALPLLGILAWNLAVYVLAAIGLITGASGRRAGILTSMARKLGKVKKTGGEAGTKNEGFGRDDEIRLAVEWFDESLPIHSARLGTMLHLAAAALAVGGVAGLFYQGWSVQYVAVWESTLFNADSLGRFFGFLFSPASWVSGVKIPLETLPEIQRGVGLDHQGGNALPWLQLYAATMGIFVVVPRLIFALIYRWHTARLISHFPISTSLRPYLSEVLQGLKGESQVAMVIPYSFEPESKVRDAVRGLLHDLWGGGIYPEFRLPPIDYGDEDEFLEKPIPNDPKYTVLLMNFSATPEDEAHGFLGKQLRERIMEEVGVANGRASGGRSMLVLLDGSGFSKRFGEMPEFQRRVEERKSAWERVMGRAGIEVVVINLPGESGQRWVDEVAGRVWTTNGGGQPA